MAPPRAWPVPAGIIHLSLSPYPTLIHSCPSVSFPALSFPAHLLLPDSHRLLPCQAPPTSPTPPASLPGPPRLWDLLSSGLATPTQLNPTPFPTWPRPPPPSARPFHWARLLPAPAETEAEAAQVGGQGVQPLVGASAGLEVDIELGELQLHVADVMQEEHKNAHLVVPGGRAGEQRGPVTQDPYPHPGCQAQAPLAAPRLPVGGFRAILPGLAALPIPSRG